MHQGLNSLVLRPLLGEKRSCGPAENSGIEPEARRPKLRIAQELAR